MGLELRGRLIRCLNENGDDQVRILGSQQIEQIDLNGQVFLGEHRDNGLTEFGIAGLRQDTGTERGSRTLLLAQTLQQPVEGLCVLN